MFMLCDAGDAAVGGAFVVLGVLIVGLLIIVAPLFIWNRCNNILDEIRRMHKESAQRMAEIANLLRYIATGGGEGGSASR